MAAGTFSQINIQLVFAVKGRSSLIDVSWEADLYKFITGLVQNKGQKLLAINGMPDHIHILIGMKPTCKLSDLVREIKKSTNTFIQENRFSNFKFEWQEGYGVFSYSNREVGSIISYINNQKQHHRTLGFREEYISFLKNHEIEFKEEFLFKWIE
tara:strand:+ start:765 stop:1229 length:465 start_codon:yes stop_codon:yes gene_type:complete